MDFVNPLQTQTVGSSVMSDKVDEILSRKAPLMSNPGSVVANNLYYDANSVAVVAAECVSNYGRYTQSLTTLQLGSAGNITIPNASFLSGLYIYAEIGALPANTFLPRGWLLNSIANVSFILGSSNVSQVQVNGATHASQMLLSCETAEKRNEVLRLAGDEAQGPQAPGTINRAYMQLQLPWSRIGSMMKKLPFDTTLLSSPIIIQIQLKQPTDFYTGSGAASAPTQFQAYRAYANQIDLMDKELSLALPLMRDPSLMYSYPFTFIQSSVQTFQGSANPSAPVNLILTGLVNADLVGISLAVLRSDRASGGLGGTQPLSPFAYERVQNVLLQYNGLTLYDAPGQMYRLYDQQDLPGSGVVPYSVISAGGAGPYVTTPADAYIIFIPFTRIRNTQFVDMFQNSFRIANNVLNLSFITPEAVPYTLYATYFYNACFAMQQGQSNLIIS
jgi:hypothetical protein